MYFAIFDQNIKKKKIKNRTYISLIELYFELHLQLPFTMISFYI